MASQKKPQRRRYSDDDRAAARAALAANGGNVERTARELGIPRGTLQRWANGQRHPEAAASVSPKKGELADRLEAVAHALVDDLARPEKITGASLPQVATALGIAVDKMRLLREQPTAITGKQLSDDERARRVAALLDLARARRAGGTAGGV